MSELRSQATSGATYMSYIAGFVLSILCTLGAYELVVQRSFSKWTIVYLVAGLALAQFVIQMLLFLHLGHEKSPRWKLLVFGSMVTLVAILVLGSLWIMHNLNYHMMSPEQINTYMENQDGGL